MNRRTFLIGTSLLAVVSATPGCALIFDGGKGPDERDYGRLLWGWLILDILFTGLIGVVIDLATGAIYVRRGGATMAGTVAPANLCRDATEMVLTVGRPRRASRYLAGHVPTAYTARWPWRISKTERSTSRRLCTAMVNLPASLSR
jgi:hypothetical protein